MQPFKRFRFVHNNKELNYPAIPEPDDFFIKRGVGTVDIPDIEAFDCPTSDINNSPRPSLLEDIPMPGMNIYNRYVSVQLPIILWSESVEVSISG